MNSNNQLNFDNFDINTVDKLYLARNIASAFLQVSNSFNHNIGLIINFYIKVDNDSLIIKNNESSNFEIVISKTDFQNALTDRNLISFSDDSLQSYIGHISMKSLKSVLKRNLTLDDVLLSIPDKTLSQQLSIKYIID